MIATKRPPAPAKIWMVFVYGVFTLCVAVFAIKKPAYNWDMLPYMGVILSYDNTFTETLHQQVYAVAKEQVPTVYYNRMTDSSNAYRNSMARNPAMFRSQFPFYIVKPLYTRIAWLLYKAGLPLTSATVWPSVISWWLTGLVMFAWMKKYSSYVFACAGSLLVMLSPPLLTVGSLSTPDALSALLLFTAVFLLAEGKPVLVVFLFFLLAILARMDNIIAALCCLPVIYRMYGRSNSMPAIKIYSMAGVLLLLCFMISWPATTYGWGIGYYPAFVKQLNTSYSTAAAFDPGLYLSLAKTQLANGLYFSFAAFFFFLVLLLFWKTSPFPFAGLTIEQVLALTFIAIMIIRFVLQPLVADRFYIPWYLSVAVFLVKKRETEQYSNI